MREGELEIKSNLQNLHKLFPGFNRESGNGQGRWYRRQQGWSKVGNKGHLVIITHFLKIKWGDCDCGMKRNMILKWEPMEEDRLWASLLSQ